MFINNQIEGGLEMSDSNEKPLNATYLFQEPKRHFHNSEDFWTSLLALFILYSSNSGKTLSLPICYCKDGNFGGTSDFLTLPFGLSYEDIIVDGKITNHAFNHISIPNEFYHLRPDLCIIKGEKIIFIENKTIGARLRNSQKELYERLVDFIKNANQKYDASVYFLVSVGYEGNRSVLENGMPKLLIWEHILKMMDNTDWIKTCFFGIDLEQYYCNDEVP